MLFSFSLVLVSFLHVVFNAGIPEGDRHIVDNADAQFSELAPDSKSDTVWTWAGIPGTADGFDGVLSAWRPVSEVFRDGSSRPPLGAERVARLRNFVRAG